MDAIIIITISLLILLVSVSFYRIASGEAIWHLNMLNFSFYVLFVLSFPSSILILLDVSLFGFNPQINSYIYGNFNNRLLVWGIVMWMFIAIPLGAIVANIIYFGSPSIISKIKSFRSSEFFIGWDYSDKSLYRIVFFASSLLVLFFIMTLPKEVPLFHALGGGGVVESQIIRQYFTFGFENKLLRGLFNEGTLTFLSLIAFIMFLRTSHRKWWIIFIAQFITLTFLSMFKGTVSHILLYLVTLAFCRKMIGSKFLKLREILLGSILISSLFIIFKGAEGNLWLVLKNQVYNRIFFSQMSGTYFAMQIFPNANDFLWFSSSAKWLNELLKGSSSESYGIILMNYYNPDSVTAGYGHMTTIFMGEAWVCFGILGIIFAPLWVGFIVQFINNWFLKRKKSVILIAFYVFLSTNSFNYATEFIGFYYPAGMIMFIVGIFIILFLGRLSQFMKNKNIVKSVNFL